MIMKKLLIGLTCLLSLAAFSGCAAVLIGAGVAGGVAISEDTAKLEADTSYNTAWKVTYATLKEMGAINSQNKDSGKIEANVQDTKIEARVIPITSKTIRVEVKARKNLLPNMDLAMTIVNKIHNKF